jgi:hypothetical protein
MKYFFCQEIFTLHTQRRIGIKSIDNPADVKLLEVAAYFGVNETMEMEKPKCNFCNRCESFQADKDKAKGKMKKEIDAKSNALNYLVFICVSVLIFISNMALWLSMSQ